MKCARPFSLQGFPAFVAHIYPYRWAQNLLMLWRWIFFFVPFCLIELFTHIPTDFLITFLAHVVKKKTAIHSLVCLLKSLLLTTCSLIVQTSSTLWQLIWLNDQSTVKINAWALVQIGLHFRKRVEKTKSCTFEGDIKNIYIYIY